MTVRVLIAASIALLTGCVTADASSPATHATVPVVPIPVVPAEPPQPRESVRVEVGAIKAQPRLRERVHGVGVRIKPIIEDSTRAVLFDITFECDGRSVRSTSQRYQRPSGRLGSMAVSRSNGRPIEVFVPFSAFALPTGQHDVTVVVGVRSQNKNVDVDVIDNVPTAISIDIPKRVNVRFLAERVELATNRRYDDSLSGAHNAPDPKWVVFYNSQRVCTSQTIDDAYSGTWRGHCPAFTMSVEDEIVLEVRDSDSMFDDLLAKFSLSLDEMTSRSRSKRSLVHGSVRRVEIDVMTQAAAE